MELEAFRSPCPACGAEGEKLQKTEIYGEAVWICPHCNGQFTERSANREYEKLEATIKSGLGSVVDEALIREKTEKYYNLRSMLWSKVNANYIDSAAIRAVCREILAIAPHDFLAEFFDIANSGTSAEIAEYVSNIDVEDNALLVDLVLDFSIRSMREAYITPIALMLEKCNGIFSPEKKQEYRTKFEDEVAKIREGIYETSLSRDVFLAYSSKDMPEVIKLLNVMEENGLSCFAAFRNLQHGRDAVANYEKALYEAIDNCSIFVFVSSKNSRSIACDAFTKEIAYIKNSEMKKFPACRSYAQIPDDSKKLRIEYRLDNQPTPIVDKSLKEFFSGLTYAENTDQLLGRIGECIEKLGAPIEDDEAKIREIEEEAERKIESEKRRADALAAEVEALKKKQAELSAKANTAQASSYTSTYAPSSVPKSSGTSSSSNQYKSQSSYGSSNQYKSQSSYGSSNQYKSQSSSTSKASNPYSSQNPYSSSYEKPKNEQNKKGSGIKGAIVDDFNNFFGDSATFSTPSKGGKTKLSDSPWSMFLICLCFGMWGLHKFIEKKYAWGILYLFSGGLLYCGWIHDLIKYYRQTKNSNK